MRSSIHSHRHRIASLHENCPRPRKLAHQAFASSQVADDAARRDTLERVLTVPRDEVAVVDDVFLAFAELKDTDISFALYSMLGTATNNTHIFPNDGAQALDPKNAISTEFADKQAFAGEHGFAETLRLVILGHARRARQESVFASTPNLLAGQANIGNIAERERSQQQLSRPRVRRNRHLTPSNELLHAEFDGAFERHGGRHGDHGAGLGFERAADGQLDGHDGVAVAVADAVAAAVESADVVDGRARAGEVALRRSAAGHLRLSARVVGPLGLFLLFLRI
jgi:hypothetical protein